jgi:superfamily I DNA/RNA helicase
MVRQSLDKTHELLEANPKHNGLYTKKFQGIQSKPVYRSRINQGYRIAWWYRSNGEIVLWRAGIRAMINALGGTTAFPEVNRPVSLPETSQEAAGLSSQRQRASVRQSLRPIFGNFSPTHLRLLGVPEDMVNAVRNITDIEEVFDLGLPSYALEILSSLYTNPTWSLENIPDTHYVFYRANARQLEGYSKNHLKKLMLDLVPEQQRLVDMKTTGPTLIKGVAGSGKTTIGIYRAMAQAMRRARQGELYGDEGRVLFLTFTETLKRAVTELFAELYGDEAERVEVAVVRDWAQAFLARPESGCSRVLDWKRAEQCLNRAFLEKKRRHPTNPLARRGPDFCRLEIEGVIKGRGLHTWEAYRNVRREGRGHGLKEEPRRFVWEVYEAYEQRLQKAGVMDDVDLAIEAVASIERNKAFVGYAEVILDEAQDLRPVELKLAAALAGGSHAQGLILLADPKQSIYYRGISWKDGGVYIAPSRVFSLKRNFRNSRPILEAAWSLAKAEPSTAFNDEIIPPEVSNKPGKTPVLIHCPSFDHEIKAAIGIVLDLCEQQRYRLGDIAVLARKKDDVNSIRNRFAVAGLPTVHFREENFKILENNIKVITINSAKGLEFPVVILVGINEDNLPRRLFTNDPDELSVELSAERQLLYVGMTRASERLYMICTESASSRFLADIDTGLMRIEEFRDGKS